MSSLELDRARHGVGSALRHFLKESGRELDLPLCAFNYARLAGLKSPESQGKAHVRTSHSDGSSVLHYLNTLEGERDRESERWEDHRHLLWQYRVNSADTFTRATGSCRSFLCILTDAQWKQLSSVQVYRLLANHTRQPHIPNIVYSI